MKLVLAAVEETEYFMTEAEDLRTRAEDIKDAVEEAYLADVAEVHLAVAMEEEETTGSVDKILKWCDAMTDNNWIFTCHMTSLKMNDIGCLRQK